METRELTYDELRKAMLEIDRLADPAPFDTVLTAPDMYCALRHEFQRQPPDHGEPNGNPFFPHVHITVNQFLPRGFWVLGTWNAGGFAVAHSCLGDTDEAMETSRRIVVAATDEYNRLFSRRTTG